VVERHDENARFYKINAADLIEGFGVVGRPRSTDGLVAVIERLRWLRGRGRVGFLAGVTRAGLPTSDHSGYYDTAPPLPACRSGDYSPFKQQHTVSSSRLEVPGAKSNTPLPLLARGSPTLRSQTENEEYLVDSTASLWQ